MFICLVDNFINKKCKKSKCYKQKAIFYTSVSHSVIINRINEIHCVFLHILIFFTTIDGQGRSSLWHRPKDSIAILSIFMLNRGKISCKFCLWPVCFQLCLVKSSTSNKRKGFRTPQSILNFIWYNRFIF